MPLPSNGTAWPPAGRHSESVAEWSAWYSGDPDQLATFYGPRTGAVPHPNQFRGGVVGRIARWWWGVPTAEGESRAKLHVPLAADICGTSADLLFSEPLRLQVEDDNPSLAAALEDLRDGGLEAKLHECAEVQAALGGVYLRTVWDARLSPMPWTEVAHPDGAVPEFQAGRLRAVTFWTEQAHIVEGVVYRLLERHEPGVILYGLYAGTSTNLGKIVPLPEHPDTAYLADMVDAEGGQATLIDRLTAQYVPNMLPNRLDRRSPQGRSDLQGVTPWLDALDEAYSSWWRDIRHAKARLHVPAQWLESNGPGAGARVDIDREVYVPIEGVLAGPDKGLADMMQAQQFAIRVAEHKETCDNWTTKIIESAGYSSQSLSGDTGGAITAAEVHSHERRSYMTRGKKVRYWTAGIREHLAVQVDIANAHMGAGITPGAFGVEFSDGVQDSTITLAQTAVALRTAEAASTETLVRKVNPDWSDDQVTAEVDRIHGENATAPLADPFHADAGL